MPEPEPVTCQCGALLGHVIEDNGVQLFLVGGLIVETLHGRCVRCKRGVHTALPSAAYKRLMSRYGMQFALEVEVSTVE